MNYYSGKLSYVVFMMCLVVQSCALSSKDITTDSATVASAGAKRVFAQGDYTAATGLYKDLLEKQPDNQDFMLYYAESLRISGSLEPAIVQYNKLASKNNLSAIEGRGLAYLQQGELAKALEDFNAVIEKDASSWRTLNAIGIIYSMEGKDEEAMKYYNMALEINPDNPSVINNIALAVAFSGDAVKGTALLQEALAKAKLADGKRQLLENNLALLYGISGKMDEAEKTLRKNLPEYAVYNNLGFYAKIASDKKLAWSYLSKAIGASPVYYEKAQTNLDTLDKPSPGYKNIVLGGDAERAEPRVVAPVKVWRGTHKLPLPSLRP